MDYPHIDPLQRAQLLKDFTEKHRREYTVGRHRGAMEKALPSIDFLKDTWKELTGNVPMGDNRRNNVFFSLAKQMGYPTWKIERVVEVSHNRKKVVELGDKFLNNIPQLVHARAVINEIING